MHVTPKQTNKYNKHTKMQTKLLEIVTMYTVIICKTLCKCKQAAMLQDARNMPSREGAMHIRACCHEAIVLMCMSTMPTCLQVAIFFGKGSPRQDYSVLKRTICSEIMNNIDYMSTI